MPIKILYFDDAHNRVPKEAATQFVRRIENKEGKLITEHWGFLDIEPEKEE